ncbi:MAG: hypothetical protein ACRDE2_13625, partial [Chitinophagaceae bacterium]
MKRIFKNTINIGVIGIALAFSAGCSKYVDKQPLDQLTDNNFWISENNVEAFCWGFYNDVVIGYSNGWGFGRFYFSSFSDDQANTTFENFDINAPASDGNWSFGDIRKANLLLAK